MNPLNLSKELVPATQEEAERLLALLDSEEGWKLVKDKKGTKVYTQPVEGSDLARLKLFSTALEGIHPDLLYDVLMDNDFRPEWDESMVECKALQRIDGRHEVNYYSAKVPAPLSNRDWVNKFSALRFPDPKTGWNQYVMWNTSIDYPDCPPNPKFVRAYSYVTGYVIRQMDADPAKGCLITYTTHGDWKGSIPTSLFNFVSKKMAPSVIKDLIKACGKYEAWKAKHNPEVKPWRYE